MSKKIDKDKARYKHFLKAILKWNFATDGRKFNGNHKELVRHIMDLTRVGLGTRALREFNKKQNKPNK